MKSEHVTRAWECYRDYNYASYKEPMRNQFRELDDYVYGLETESAKLRELCAEMFEAVKCCCGEWCTKTVSNCDNNECGWHKCYVALRELGIEVEDA